MMEAIVIKYVQLVCLTIFMQGNADCAQMMGHSEEMNNLSVSACAASCLNTRANYVSNEFRYWNLELQIFDVD